jgi:hypothetical protein
LVKLFYPKLLLIDIPKIKKIYIQNGPLILSNFNPSTIDVRLGGRGGTGKGARRGGGSQKGRHSTKALVGLSVLGEGIEGK